MLEGLFQFLFKYRPLVFEQGDFVLGASRPMRLVILAAAAAAAYALFTYRRAGRAEPRDRLALAGLRLVDVASTRYAIARRYMIRLRRDDFQDPHELAKLASTVRLSPEEFRHQFDYLMASEPPPLLIDEQGESQAGHESQA